VRIGRSGGLGPRLLAAVALVVATAAVTAWLVAGALGPAIFHEHLASSGSNLTPEQAVLHAEEAFRAASGLALAFGLGAAVLAALAMSVFVARRIRASLAALTAAASQVAGGRFEARVPSPNMGSEFDELVDAFNQMAARLDASDDLRRRLLSDVAHELRTPVATIDAYLEGLEDDVTELNPQTVALLRAQGSRLIRLSEDLSAVSKAESGELTLVRRRSDVAGLLALAHLAASDRAVAAGVTLDLEVDEGLPAVLVDVDRLCQVLGNLVDNALRHTPRGGRITIAGTSGDGVVTLAVDDSGDGIAAEHLPFVFERFYRADAARDRASGGSGIGLAIVKAVVEAHGGSVRAESAGPGTGARFVITLPADRVGGP
jgi:two-component system, OmpR family, sensor histidine kinase BaeS